AGRNVVVCSAHVGLEVPEEAFDGVGVYVAFDVDALRVLDAAEPVLALPLYGVVSAPVVREDHGRWQDELAEGVADRVRRLALRARCSDERRAEATLPLDGGEHHRAIFSRGASVRAAFLPQLRALGFAEQLDIASLSCC